MASMIEVMSFLRPNGGYVTRGETFESIEFIECEPFTEQEFNDAFEIVDQSKIEKANEILLKRQAALAKLAALGLEPDDLKALGL